MLRNACVYVTTGWLVLLGAVELRAQTAQELKRMSLEDLLNVDVTTVSRGPEPTMRVPAAVYVITQQEIRRSGARSIPEALRLAPGVQVARIDAGTWAIGMRGFADRLARSMLVLIDGRAVYSPLFAGTYWETQDILLEDVDRIEVIRGPGGTLWGANAVNGIINIITKPAKESAGLVATIAGGIENRSLVGVRYGGSIGDAWNYRVYGKAFDRTAQFHANGPEYDGLRLGEGGFRADWTPSNDRTFTIQGDLYDARLGERQRITTYTRPFTEISEVDAPLSGGNVLGRWSGPLAGKGRFRLQAFYARTNRDERPVAERRDTVDIDFQQTAPAWRRHQLVWGAGYRVTSGRITAVPPTGFDPDERTDSLYSGFVQDEMTLIPDRLRLTLGSKLEHNDYSGFELQPGVRLQWTPQGDRTFWSSFTRAVRTPSRVETDYTTTSLVNPSVPLFVRLLPNPGFRPEKLSAYEAGYRLHPVAPMYVSFSGFYNSLDDVLSTEVLRAFPEPASNPIRLVVPVAFGNGLHGDSYGGEISAELRPAPWWHWTANYSYVRIQVSKQPGSLDGSQERRGEGLSPRHQVQLLSSVDLPRGWSLDGFVRYISELPAGPVPAYGTANVRVAWQLSPEVELAIVGRDLAQAHHLEWAGDAGTGIEIERSAYVALTWRH